MVFNWILMEMRSIRQTNDGPSVACYIVKQTHAVYTCFCSIRCQQHRMLNPISIRNCHFKIFENCILSDSLNFDAIIYQLELLSADSEVVCACLWLIFNFEFPFSTFRRNFVVRRQKPNNFHMN